MRNRKTTNLKHKRYDGMREAEEGAYAAKIGTDGRGNIQKEENFCMENMGSMENMRSMENMENMGSMESMENMELEEFLVNKLILAAQESREKAYAPYSHYQVGAALLTADEKIYQGCNIENASYGATNCAERTAFFKAVSEGERNFRAIAIMGGREGKEPEEYAYPCGICRQVMQEFCKPDFLILVVRNRMDYKVYTLGQLLPSGFKGDAFL